MLNKIGEKHPVFQDPDLLTVGSLKEGTKIGFIDEADFALIMNKKYKKGYFEFNSKKQQVELARKDTYDISRDRQGERYKRSDLPEELAYFVSEDGVFDCTKYFQIFVEEVHKVIEDNSVELPKGLSLTVKFTPCEVCKSTEDITPQYVRCRHKSNCAEHKKKQQNPQYKEKCKCNFFNLPSMSYSKIGVVLHFVYHELPLKPFIIDVDINPPSLHVEGIKYFDGSNKMKRLWLKKNRRRIRNWRAESRKTYDMSAAGNLWARDKNGNFLEDDEDYGYVRVGTRSVRFRLVNRNMVIPEQVRFQYTISVSFFRTPLKV